VATGDVFTAVYSTILWLAGFTWLYLETDFGIFQSNWKLILLITFLILVFTKLSFFMIIEFRSDRYGSTDGALNSMMVWTAVFTLGIGALWIMIAIKIIEFILLFRQPQNKSASWNHYRNLALNLAGFTIPYLIGMKIYQGLGGPVPIEIMNVNLVGAGLLAIAINFFLFALIWSPYFIFALNTQKQLAAEADTRPIITFFIFALALPTIAHPFSIIASSLLTRDGLFIFMFFISGLLLVAYIARRFSWIAESNRQQSRQLEKLEQLGRAILNSPPDGSSFTTILDEHIPNMFPAGNLAIGIKSEGILYKSPEDWDKDFSLIWEWCHQQNEAKSFTSSQKLPWVKENQFHHAVVCCPIIAFEGTEIMGGIYLELRILAHPWDSTSLKGLFPAVHALSDQIASALHQAEEYANTITLQKVSQELQIAGQIQASFLPNQFPTIPGWQLAVTLQPAGGLSGDFFDFIPLSRGRLGIVIADVADKGLGAALYMALTRTLLRTYAFEYHSRPDIVFNETNERILADARANLFITCFYGVLDPKAGTLMYCNAGHNPPYLFRADVSQPPMPLVRTGIPIGVEEDRRWKRKTVTFSPGDKLVLYTDGVTEAQNEQGDFFEDDMLIEAALENSECNAFELQTNILSKVENFVGENPQSDDITLMVLYKNRQETSK